MQIKLIVTDLDGTLLTTDKKITDYTKAVLQQCRQAGIKVVYATGRGTSAERRVPENIVDAQIMINGAIAKIGEKLIYHRLISYETARPFLVACDKRGLKMTSELSGMHYTNFTIPDEWESIVPHYEIVDFTAHSKDAEKLYTFALTPEDVIFINGLLPSDLYMVMAVDGLAMIMHKDATKAKAIAALADMWGIKPEEIVAFGDDLNDIDMLGYAGVGVVMDNALEQVKTVADYICDTNDNDGLAKWLEENVL